MKIDLASISPVDFSLSPRGDYILITPRPHKHTWAPEERKLRSLLVTQDGTVVSSGFPKFVNYGEDPADDEAFRVALRRGLVTFTEKLDGSLIIASPVGNKWHLRTRGNDTLGDFHADVWETIRLYPDLHRILTSPPRGMAKYWHLLFEYTSPKNQIVLRYDNPELHLLALVDPVTLGLTYEVPLQIVASETGVPLAPERELPKTEQELIAFVRSRVGEEGVVARFTDPQTFQVRLLKIKTEEYVKLHSLKFRLEGKVKKLCLLLDVKTQDDGREKLHNLGIDFEVATFVENELLEFVVRRLFAERRLAQCRQMWETVQPRFEKWYEDARERRKHAVEFFRSWGGEFPWWGPMWFNACMRIYDGKLDEAYNLIYADIIGESVHTVRQWRMNARSEIDDMLKQTPVEDMDP